jgi:hypothetical protein
VSAVALVVMPAANAVTRAIAVADLRLVGFDML